MSLINRMLEDLEKRDPASTAGRGTLRRRNARELLPWLLVGILLVACGVLAWLALASDESLTTSSTTLAVTPEVSAPVVAETQAVEAAPAETPAVSSTTETEQDETGQPAVVRAPAPTSAVAATTATRAASSSEPDAAPSTLSPAEPQPQESLPQDPEEPGTMQVAPAFVDPQAAAQQQIDTGLRALSRGQLDTATRNLRNGLAVLEDNDAAREALYVAYRRQGRLAEAEGVLRDGLAVASRPTTFAKLMARDLLARGDLQQALAVMALHDPAVGEDSEFHALRGSLLLQAADFAAAAEVYGSLVAFDASNGPWRAGLGISQEQLGDREAAEQNFKAALEAGGLAPSVENYVRQRLPGGSAGNGD